MKKIIIYIGILIAGLLLGYLFFGNSSEEKTANHEHEQGETETMWTCSMHPQIMQPEPGDCPICGMDLIPADASSDGLGADEISMTENAMKLANIQTSIVGQGNGIDGKITLSGKIMESEDQNSVQSSHVGGRIENLNISSTGEKVNRGALLARIYSPELVAAQQELITAAKLKESQPSLYNAVRNKLKFWKLSDNQINQIESSGQVTENFPVYSNVSGVVTEKMVQEGDYVERGQGLLKIANLDKVWAVFDAYESQISNLKEGQDLDISINAIPNENFSGKISFINPILDNASRTVEVRVVLNNSNNQLKPGMFVQAAVESTSKSSNESLEVPKSAVMWTGERSLVYVKTSATEPVFEMREVKLGNSSGETYQVLEGLSSGEEVVTNGTFTVDAAAQLQGKSSMMNQKVEMDSEMGMEMKLSNAFQSQFKQLLPSYFELKDALVASDADKTSAIALELLQKTEKINIEGSSEMLSGHIGKIREMLEGISENEKLENQRDHFRILSQQMILVAGNVEKLDSTIYLQHCPMANSNKGADWLSLSKNIENPYYGEAMLNCGETTKTL
ncbi:efflux RND transporter periplasmic adaptor subunit [Christiangramia forsetii]|uniref:HlyD family secretion protein n=2 Tax=Christiangramia forsetii TaxID=411153 RepID=A0M5K1_CHRFK|nr:efflux RND transporter periplasmic adaptor subunit [Christiangramia forsetii]GGG32757.1 hypothetical protein GCM10011532_15430 [Christiangramia forsetii]CAL67896.1 HlyD family secretion protein [Christiangramia forsetii KT0803]